MKVVRSSPKLHSLGRGETRAAVSLRGPAPTRDSSTRRRTPLPLHPRPSQKAAAGASFFALRGRLRGQLGAPAPPPTPFSQPRLNRPRLSRGAPTRPRPALREARGHRETADPANRRSLPGARARTQCTYIGASPRRPFLSTQPLQPPPPCTITLLRGRAEVSFPVPTPMDSGPMAVRTCGKPANQRPLGGVGGVEGDGEVEVG